jgi:hypothetical protein
MLEVGVKEFTMQPHTSNLLDKLGPGVPLIGFYDTPDPEPFQPLIELKSGRHACVFACYKQWLKGKSLHITQQSYGCRGAGRWLCGQEATPREEMVRFLVDDEGLKSSHELMHQWLDHRKGYEQEHPHLIIGPLNPDQYQHLRSVTFYINPDQLGLLMLGAQYHSAPGDPTPVIAPFGSGCSQLVSLFGDLDIPQAIVGSTDIAMREYLPPDLLAFTVTRPMFEQLCGLGEESFLHKPFWSDLQKARGFVG